jgi:glycosyltransferase involved in cell wall biosynthesis
MDVSMKSGAKSTNSAEHPQQALGIEVSLLTGAADKPYAFGLATELAAEEVVLDVIGNDELDCPEFHGSPKLNFLNLRGDQDPNVSRLRKALRVLLYYLKLIRYAAGAQPRIFHILWNNKFKHFDRTILMLYYRWLGKKVVLTVHNVNAETRDSRDSWWNRLTLRLQYQLADHLFLHTEKMREELIEGFGVARDLTTVIPFGINNAVPQTDLSSREARARLGIRENEKVILFFGHIAPYKGLEYLVAAFQKAALKHGEYRLVVAGRPKNCEKYWQEILESIRDEVRDGRILLRAEYIPDKETEVFFKAADVMVLPYRYIYQSGVLFLGYSFGLPVLAADVGALKEDVVEGKTGFVFAPENSEDLARVIENYFASDLYKELSSRRRGIIDYANERNSWHVVGELTRGVYAKLLHHETPEKLLNERQSEAHGG